MLRVLSWVFGLTGVLVITAAISHGLFAIMNSAGWVCREANGESQFSTKSLCWASGIHVEEGKRYRITLVIQTPWKDLNIIPPSINGFGFESMPWTMYPGLLLRRHIGEAWFRPIARIGAQGRDEYPLDLRPDGELSAGPFTAEITARRSGELFLFVNDAILPLPTGWQFFYNNNQGVAHVNIEPVVPSS
jgi:hypothetical protein